MNINKRRTLMFMQLVIVQHHIQIFLKELVVNFSVSDAMRGAYVAAKISQVRLFHLMERRRQMQSKFFGLNLFSTGITVTQAERYNIPCEYVDYETWQRPKFMLKNDRVKLRLVYHKQTHRLLGAQIATESDQAGTLHMLFISDPKRSYDR